MALSAALVLSGIPKEQFSGNVLYIYDHGSVLLKSPPKDNLTPSTSAVGNVSTSENQVNFTTQATAEKVLDYYLGVIAKLEERFQIFTDEKLNNEEKELLYQERNLLDLGHNIKTNWLFPTAKIKEGVNHFFENRSQLSRLEGLELPRHLTICCDEEDCDFRENLYF